MTLLALKIPPVVEGIFCWPALSPCWKDISVLAYQEYFQMTRAMRKDLGLRAVINTTANSVSLYGHITTSPSIQRVRERRILVLFLTVPPWRHTRDKKTWDMLCFALLEGSLQGLGHFQTSCDIHLADTSVKKAVVWGIPMDGLPWEAHHVLAVRAFSFIPILTLRSSRAPYCSFSVRLYDISRLKSLENGKEDQ